MAKILNANIDINLGGENASNEVISSQKATKTYVDNKSLGVISDTNGNVILGNSMGGGIIGADHALATNLDYAHAGHTGFMKDDASNLTTDGQKVFDGQWDFSHLGKFAADVTLPKTTPIEYDISSYMPVDNYNYEVIISVNTVPDATAVGNNVRVELGSDLGAYTGMLGDGVSQVANQASRYGGTTIIPVGPQRKIIVYPLSWIKGTFSMWYKGCRRIGTNV